MVHQPTFFVGIENLQSCFSLMLELNGQRKWGRTKQIWRRQVEENVKRIMLEVKEEVKQDGERERSLREQGATSHPRS